MSFLKINWNDRVRMIEHELPGVLRGLAHVSPTSLVAERLTEALDLPEEERGHVSNMLLKLAPRHPLAAHNGGEFKSYGRTCRRWTWAPGESVGWEFAPVTAAPQYGSREKPGFQAYLLTLAKKANETGDKARVGLLREAAALHHSWLNGDDAPMDAPKDDGSDLYS